MINEEILSDPFSLFIAICNGEQYLEEPLESVFSQVTEIGRNIVKKLIQS